MHFRVVVIIKFCIIAFDSHQIKLMVRMFCYANQSVYITIFTHVFKAMTHFTTSSSIMITPYIPPSIEPFKTLTFLQLFKYSFSNPSPKLSQPEMSKFFKLGHVKKVLLSSKSIQPLKFKSCNCDD